MTQGLRGKADQEGTGIVHLDGLWSYLQDKVTDASRMAGNQQNPVLIGEHSHKLPLTLNPLITEKKRRVAEKVRELIGLDDDDLTTEEARMCLQILCNGPANGQERDVQAEFDSLLTEQLRISTFKRLIQSAMASMAQSESKRMQVPQSHMTEQPSREKGSANGQHTNTVDDVEAIRIIDAWSMENPEYLNPLSVHAKLEDCNDSEIYKVTVTVLSESRSTSTKLEPFAGDPASTECAETSDIWSIPFHVPAGFGTANETWSNSKPRRILTCNDCGGKGENICPECHGTGEWVCNDCHGEGGVMCEECRGTGKDHRRHFNDDSLRTPIGDGTFSQKRKCKKCHGSKTIPCTSCKGPPKRPCTKCGGGGTIACKKCASAGRVAEYDAIESTFALKQCSTILKATSGLPDIEQPIKQARSQLVLSWVMEEKTLPASLAQLPTDIAWQLRQYWDSTLHRLRARFIVSS